MKQINLKDLNLKKEESTFTFDFEGQTIEVLKYLPIEDKYDLVMITLQKAEEEDIYNPIKLDMYFNLHLVKMYTNITFEAGMDDGENYDFLRTSGLLDKIIDIMDTEEYNDIYTLLDDTKVESTKYKNTAQAVFKKFINDLPKNAALAADIVNNFDPSQYQAVVDFANAVGADGNKVFSPLANLTR